jgi:hypothetical protein
MHDENANSWKSNLRGQFARERAEYQAEMERMRKEMLDFMAKAASIQSASAHHVPVPREPHARPQAFNMGTEYINPNGFSCTGPKSTIASPQCGFVLRG